MNFKLLGAFVLCILFMQPLLFAQADEWSSGFTQSSSGLKYKIMKQGIGDFPRSGDKVWIHFAGFLANDSIFENTMNKGPMDLFLGKGQLIKGWEEGLQLIKPGGTILLIVPPELAYGAMDHPFIPKNSTLRFEISLLQIDKGTPIELFSLDGLKLQKAKKNLRYYLVEEGTGTYAQKGDNAYVHYTAYLGDGTIFDSSHKNGEAVRITVGINQVIAGWDMGLELMQKGSKIHLVIPPKLAYGKLGYKNLVPANATIHLDLEMVDLVSPKPVVMWNNAGKPVKETLSGLKYVVFEAGTGELIENEDVVEVHYSGYFTNGELFDSSVKRFEPIRFPVGIGAVIDAWDEGLLLMRKGSKFQLLVPSHLAYGEAGAPPQIPANSDLIFDIEVLDIIH
jgi:peptidylprolyl isomerase